MMSAKALQREAKDPRRLGSVLVQLNDASLVQVPPQSGLKTQIMIYIKFQWLLSSFKIVVRKFPVVFCDKSIGTNLVTGMQSCQQNQGPCPRHAYVLSIGVKKARIQKRLCQVEDEVWM